MVDRVEQYVVFDAERLMQEKVEAPLTPEIIDGPVWKILDQTHTGLSQTDYHIDSVPLVTFYPGEIDTTPEFTPQIVFSVSSRDTGSANKFRNAVIESIRLKGALLSIGTNPAIGIGQLEFSIPVAPDATLFGSLEDACRLINADQLPPNLNGDSVNIVLVDTGIDRNIIVPPGHYGGGWRPRRVHPTLPRPPRPGTTTGPDALHGAMVVNNIFAVAPNARIFDVPLIPPPKIYDIFSFLHVAHATFHHILHDILWFQAHGIFRGPWIFMNAWAIFDRRSEGIFLGEYTENNGPRPGVPHPFIHQIEQIAQARFDMVFCAGNCGELCPDGRCGPDDYGPGRGIWGANAHQDVLTAGAVCVDATWSGYSSEGPGPTPHLCAEKPDLCAPSQFVSAGEYPPNTGTSASAALTAGTVAALRSNWNQARVPPFVLRLILNNAAMQPLPPGWNRWFGNGILDAFAAYRVLLRNYP